MKEEYTHTIRIRKSQDVNDIYYVDLYCSFTNSGSREDLAKFYDVHRAYEYALWQSQKRGFGITFQNGVEKLIFPEVYEKAKKKRKKGK